MLRAAGRGRVRPLSGIGHQNKAKENDISGSRAHAFSASGPHEGLGASLGRHIVGVGNLPVATHQARSNPVDDGKAMRVSRIGNEHITHSCDT